MFAVGGRSRARTSRVTPAASPDLVRELDALCARAWPSFEREECGGWIFRSAAGFSLRSNSVWAADLQGGMTVEERISRAEAFYAARNLPARFQISPATRPARLEAALIRRGYSFHTTTDVMIARDPTPSPSMRIELTPLPSETWRQVMLDSAHDSADAHGRLAIVHRIGLPRAHATAWVDGRAAAIGLGVADGNWLGVFAMRTHPDYRRRGLARAIVATLREWAAARAANVAYLQVESDNAAAIALYSGLGFARAYAYRYCTREL